MASETLAGRRERQANVMAALRRGEGVEVIAERFGLSPAWVRRLGLRAGLLRKRRRCGKRKGQGCGGPALKFTGKESFRHDD